MSENPFKLLSLENDSRGEPKDPNEWFHKWLKVMITVNVIVGLLLLLEAWLLSH